MRRVPALVAALVALVLAGCGGSGKHAATGGGTASLSDVRGPANLTSLFNQASGEPRLVVLVSPT